MKNETLVLVTQDMVNEGCVTSADMMKTFDALLTGKEYFIPLSQFVKQPDLATATIKEIEKPATIKKQDSQLQKLITIVEKKCISSGGTMSVELDGVNSEYDVFQNILDEIASLEITLDSSDIEEEPMYNMTTREAKGYVSKMKTFIKNNVGKFLAGDQAVEILKSVK